MIGKLKGIVESISDGRCLLDVNGVCYQVFASGTTLQALPAKGEAAELLIETHVREDHIHLYGFATTAEQVWFTTLLSVNGVGTRMALAILSVLSPDQLIAALSSGDKAAFTQISGVGPKLASRLITELKDKVDTITSGYDSISMTKLTQSGTRVEPIASNALSASVLQDSLTALTQLGYSRSEAYRIVHQLAQENPEITVEELIRKGLQQLATA